LSTSNALALRGGRVVDAARHRCLDEGAAQRTALDDQCGRRDFAHLAQRGDQVARHAAGDQELFLGAHQQVELRQHLLQLGGDGGVRHVARFAVAALGQAPILFV